MDDVVKGDQQESAGKVFSPSPSWGYASHTGLWLELNILFNKHINGNRYAI